MAQGYLIGFPVTVDAGVHRIDVGTAQLESTIAFSAGANITLSVNGQTIEFIGRAGLGVAISNSTTHTSGTIVFAAGANITLQTAGSTISIVGAAAGGTPAAAVFEPYLLHSSFTQAVNLGVTDWYVLPFTVPHAMTFDHVRLAWSVGNASTNFGTTSVNTTMTYQCLHTFHYALYTKGTGASSMSLMLYSSTSAGLTELISYQAGGTGSHYSMSQYLTFPVASGASTASFSTALSSASIRLTAKSQWSGGGRFIEFPFAASMSAGAFFLAMAHSSATSTQGKSDFHGNRLQIDNILALPLSNLPTARFGEAGAASTVPMLLGQGLIGSAGVPAEIAFSIISTSAFHQRPYVQFLRIA